MLEGVGDSSNLEVGNFADTPPLIPKFCMRRFLGCNTLHTDSGPGTVRGTIRQPPLLPTNPECYNLRRLLLCIPVVRVGNGSNHMVSSIVCTRKLLDLSGMLA